MKTIFTIAIAIAMVTQSQSQNFFHDSPDADYPLDARHVVHHVQLTKRYDPDSCGTIQECIEGDDESRITITPGQIINECTDGTNTTTASFASNNVFLSTVDANEIGATFQLANFGYPYFSLSAQGDTSFRFISSDGATLLVGAEGWGSAQPGDLLVMGDDFGVRYSRPEIFGLQESILANDTCTQTNTVHCENYSFYFDKPETFGVGAITDIDMNVINGDHIGQTYVSGGASSMTGSNTATGEYAQVRAIENGANSYAQMHAGDFPLLTSITTYIDTLNITTPEVNAGNAIPGSVMVLQDVLGTVEFQGLPQGVAVPDATGPGDVVATVNAILASLRGAGYIAP